MYAPYGSNDLSVFNWRVRYKYSCRTHMAKAQVAQTGWRLPRGPELLEICQKRLCSGEDGVNVAKQCFGVVFRDDDRVALLCEEAERASIVLRFDVSKA